MLSILNPKYTIPLDNQNYLGAGWNYVLDYSWIYNNIKTYDNTQASTLIIFDVGCGKRSKLWKFIIDTLGIQVIRIDRRPIKGVIQVENFLNFKHPLQPDIIYWASSIEHNTMDEMKKLYLHSMDLLREGGLFLATIALSEETFWDERTKQTNLSLSDAMKVFDETCIEGNFYGTRDCYRKNYLNLKNKYKKRFGHFGDNDPSYIVGGVKKIK